MANERFRRWPAAARAPVAGPSLPYLIGAGALLALAGLFVWQSPPSHGPAGAALAAALALDAASRLVAEAVSRRSGIAVAIRGLPSVIFALGGLPVLAASCLALALLGPVAFPVLASLIAGIVAMGALARLALAHRVRALAKMPAKTDPLTPL